MHKTYTPLVLITMSVLSSCPLRAEGSISSVEQLPPSVKALYFATCTTDSWMGHRRKVGGSSSKTLSDGTELFLMVCGDAASIVPFYAIALRPSGSAFEVQMAWTLKGKDHSSGFGNARFGSKLDTVVSNSHSSATCTPGYTHRWNGSGLELIAYNGTGCEDQ